jgi:mannosyltransferase OCH1-like enzyme
MVFRLSLLLLACFVTFDASASRLPDLDPMTHAMGARFATVPAPGADGPARYFDAAIPKMVHQIWFGERARMCSARTAQWQRFSERFGYTYRLWSEADDSELALWMPPQSYDLLRRLRAGQQLHAASDLLRFSLLRHFGGVYCDADMSPPALDGALVDLASVMPMRGMVLLTENFALNVGNSAMFFANGLMMAAPEHPVFVHLERTLPGNIEALYPGTLRSDAPIGAIDAVYATGPAFLSRSLSGTFTTLPITYARRLGMVHDGKWDAESGEPFTFDEIGGPEAWQCTP